MQKKSATPTYDFKLEFEATRTSYLKGLADWKNTIKVANVTASAGPSGTMTGTLINTGGFTDHTLLISAVQSELLQTFVSCFREFSIIRYKAHFLGLVQIPDAVMKNIKITGDELFNICCENPKKLLEILSEKSATVVAWNANPFIKDSRNAFFNKTNTYNKTDYGTLLLHNCVRNMFQHNHGKFNKEIIEREQEAKPNQWRDTEKKRVKITDVLKDGVNIELNWFVVEELTDSIINIIKTAQI